VNLPRLSVQRPVFIIMMTIMVLVIGSVALSRLQIDLLPSIELPTLTVRTDYDGANPVVVERQVTQIIEEIIATVPGIEEISSESEEGDSSVRVTFGWGTNIDAAAMDLQATLEDEINELPDDIVGPRISKFDIDSFPVVLMGISSTLDPVEMTTLMEDQLRHRFVRLPGVAQVDPWGGFNREVRVELDPDRINAHNLPVNDILEALEDSNLDLPTGKIEDGRFQINLLVPAEFSNLEEIRQTRIAHKDGIVVTLGQIATVTDTYEKLTRIIRVNGERGLRLAIRKQPNANTVEVAQRILDEIDQVNREFPQLTVVPVINQGNFIERSIDNVSRSILYGGALSVLVLLLFLRNLRSTFVIAVAIPISVVATFALLYFSGFTLNLMTLGGLALGVGLMVDSSVVVLENIYRHFSDHDESPSEAAIKGSGEVASAVVAGTITTLVVFLPLVFVQGVSGVLFKELAFVIMFSLFCALIVSLSLVPMLASRLIRSSEHRPATGMENLKARVGRAFDSMETRYQHLLRLALHHRALTLLLSLLIFCSSWLLAPHIGTEFLPPTDEGEVRVSGEMEIGTRLELIDAQTRLMEAIVLPAVPEAVSSVTSIRSENARGEIRMSLVPAAERERSNTEIAQALRDALEGQIPGMTIRTRAPQGQFLLERILGSDEGIEVEVRGFDLSTLTALGEQVADILRGVDGITDIELSRKAGVPQNEFLLDRAKIADLGLTVREVANVIATGVAGTKAGEYRVEGNAYRILVQLKDAEKRSLDEILDLTLSTPDGDAVALRNLLTTQPGFGPISIERKDQQRLVTITANVAGRDMGSVARDIESLLFSIPRPKGYDIQVAGNVEEQEEAFRELLLSLLLALVLVYVVLASQYESFRDPLIVMFSVPLAATGVLVTLYLTGSTMNLQSGIGCLMLGGIVVNNAILLVDQAGRLRQQTRNTEQALLEAGRRRLRPILMTTLTTILALLPLAFGIGEGADAQAPLARAVIGGLIGSTLITLVLVPVVYALMHPAEQTGIGNKSDTHATSGGG